MASSDVISGLFQSIDASTILSSLGLLVLTIAAIRVSTYVLTRLSELKVLNVLGLNRITVKMLIPLLKFSFYFAAIYYILAVIFNIASNQLILFSGLLGAGLGFGLQNLFGDVVGGLLIVAERPYQIGDKINLGGHYGEVKDIGLRVTRLVTPDDTLVSVPNGSILQSPVANVNAGNLEMMVVIDLFIDPNSDARLAMQILREALLTSQYIRLSDKHPYVILMKDFPFYKRIRAKGYANDFRYEFIFETDVTRRAWQEFRRTGIKPPRMAVSEMGIINDK
ncbi:MAG: Large-conductance mechanosensitive channel MscMJLR [Euryarchaeota archaeon]|nr:Large-conductance mechanosensitive channel MscMJLR [Euryarchaeota archaeon]